MSGGVDSSVAAKLLCDAGHECTGCTLRLYVAEDAGLPREGGCCSLDDCFDARSVAYSLGMRYFVLNFTEEFRERVMAGFAASYRRGETPNPCIDCNRFIKFGALMRRAELLGFDAVATGHYARIGFENGRYTLMKAADASKDQSYVLYAMTQEQLARTLFPLGGLTKTQVRKIAAQSGFINARKPDSQDICFVPDGDCAAAVERISGVKNRPGRFVDTQGRTLGTHAGAERFTIGQHRGLGIPLPAKRFVCGIDPESGDVTLSEESGLYSRDAVLRDLNWISGTAPDAPLRCMAKTRYRAPESAATVYPAGDGRWRLVFDEPQRAITPGQAAVLYIGEYVLGGGTICRAQREEK